MKPCGVLFYATLINNGLCKLCITMDHVFWMLIFHHQSQQRLTLNNYHLPLCLWFQFLRLDLTASVHCLCCYPLLVCHFIANEMELIFSRIEAIAKFFLYLRVRFFLWLISSKEEIKLKMQFCYILRPRGAEQTHDWLSNRIKKNLKTFWIRFRERLNAGDFPLFLCTWFQA